MRVIRIPTDHGERFHLVDGAGEPLPLVTSFVLGLQARGCSPNTIIAYHYDLRRFYQFLDSAGLSVERFVAAHTVDFLGFLNGIEPRQRQATVFPALVRTGLSPTSINRAGRRLDLLRASGANRWARRPSGKAGTAAKAPALASNALLATPSAAGSIVFRARYQMNRLHGCLMSLFVRGIALCSC